jgi:hypothetical protein
MTAASFDPPDNYRNWLTLLGAVLTTVSAVLFLIFFLLDLAGFHTNPYMGIVTFLLLPAAFVLGLALIPLGVWRERRRLALGKPVTRWPVLDFSRPNVRWGAIVLLALTCVNIAIVAMAAVKSVEYVDSTAFCTGACHTPMEPEAVAQRRSVHASISCSSCHIGPGPQGFVTAKVGGVRRLASVVTGAMSRPIPVPVHALPSTTGTCGSCHTPTKYIGEVAKQFRYYSDDEGSTEQVTNLTLLVGGGGYEAGGPQGIHWHASPQTRIEYISTDGKRETIPWVRVTDHRGDVREYMIEGFSPEQVPTAERRVMDCTDCHNRQGHPIAPSTERAVDEALAKGLLPRSLPFVRREAIAALNASGRDRAMAEQQISERLSSFYAQQQGVGRTADPLVKQAIAASQRLYLDNVFPEMNVSWGTYPNQRGHTDFPGCFRCHDEQHTSRTGAVITQNCESCHRMQ